MQSKKPADSFNISNLLSGFRLIAAPIMLYLAWAGYPNPFLILLGFSLISDSVDGFLARRFNWVSQFGTKLDSWGDFATYMTVPLCAWWLWPNIIRREALFVILALGAYVTPTLVGFLKFKRLPSLHTWSAKTAAVLMSVSALLLFIADIALPFRIAAIFQVLVASEEIAIIVLLAEWRGNVHSLWHASKWMKQRNLK
jgi:CDP-diacylglycerol---glycerol-3-phosphate 3-phosphatidyltransferase